VTELERWKGYKNLLVCKSWVVSVTFSAAELNGTNQRCTHSRVCLARRKDITQRKVRMQIMVDIIVLYRVVKARWDFERNS